MLYSGFHDKKLPGYRHNVNDPDPPSDARDDLPVNLAAYDTQTAATRLYARGGRQGITVYIDGCLDETAWPFFASIAELAQQVDVPCTIDLENACAISEAGIKALKDLQKVMTKKAGELRIIRARPNIRGLLFYHGLGLEDEAEQ